MDGPAAISKFSYPFGVAINNTTGDVYVSEYGTHTIRKISMQGTYDS